MLSNLLRAMLAATALLISQFSTAAEPVNSRFVQDVVQGDQIYAHYVVSCSNGSSADISAWNNRSKWCVGKGQQNICGKSQARIAKRVCQQAASS